MRLLLDTHTFLWFILDHPNLSIYAKSLIEDSDNEVLVSIVSFWEMAIKVSLGKLDLPVPFNDLIPAQIIANDMIMLPIVIPHLHRVVRLPFHHRDPFDRLLIAQCIVEGLPIISRDGEFEAYPIQQLWK